MSYFQKVWKSDARAVIEELIKAGEYDKAQGGVKDIVSEIRSMEDGYRQAKRICMLLKFETDRTRKSGIAVTDRTGEISDIVESGEFDDAVSRAKVAIDELKQVEDEYTRAENSLLILKSEIERASVKGAVIPYSTSGVEDLIATGSYNQATSDSEGMIVKVREIEEGYDSATRFYGVIGDWIAYFEERGIMLPVEQGELKGLIDEGKYDEAIPVARTLLERLRECSDNFLERLEKELERCREEGIVIPFDTGDVKEALGNGDYDGARSLADRLFSDIRSIESNHRGATDLLDRLKTETARLHEKGVVFADEAGTISSMMESGEYGKVIIQANTMLVTILSAEKDYESAMEARNALKEEMSRLREKGVVFPDNITGIEGLIEKGMYHDARIRANNHEVEIRLAETDHDFAVSMLNQLNVETKRLEASEVIFSVETGLVQELINKGRYEEARKEAESGLIKLWAADSNFESAIEFLQALNQDYDRAGTKGVVVTNESNQVEDLIKKGEYHKARSMSESLLTEIRKTESEYDSVASAYTAYKREVARAGMKEIPVTDESASIESLRSSGKYREARLEAEALLSRVKSLVWEYELAIRSYESLVREIDRLKGEGIIITEDPSSVKDFIDSGSYQQAKSIAENLHSRIKGIEWEYQLAVKAHDELRRIMDEMKGAGEEPAVSLAELEKWIERGDYRKAKSVAEDIANILFK